MNEYKSENSSPGPEAGERRDVEAAAQTYLARNKPANCQCYISNPDRCRPCEIVAEAFIAGAKSSPPAAPRGAAEREPAFDLAHKMQRIALDLAWRAYGHDDEYRMRLVEWLREYGLAVWKLIQYESHADAARPRSPVSPEDLSVGGDHVIRTQPSSETGSGQEAHAGSAPVQVRAEDSRECLSPAQASLSGVAGVDRAEHGDIGDAARPRSAPVVDNGNTFIFCNFTARSDKGVIRGCVRGAGHNGPHAMCLYPYPYGPVFLTEPDGSEARSSPVEAQGWQLAVFDELRQMSAQADNANNPTEYNVALVALAMAVRGHLRKLDGTT